jgi:hypothetical protein
VQAVWACDAARGCEPAVSPDGKLLLLGTDHHVCLIDLDRAEAVASQPAIEGTSPKFSFSPSGSRFACTTTSAGCVWETATGEVYRRLEYAALPASARGAAVFAGEEHVMLNNRYLINLPNQIALWDYEGLDTLISKGELVWGFAADHSRSALVPAKLPHPAVTKLLDEALADPDHFVLKAGGAVKLNLDALPDATQRERARAALTKSFEARQIRVDATAPVELIASFDPPEQKDVAYRMFGGGVQSFDFNEIKSRIAIVWQGQTLWQTYASNRPFMLHVERGESVEEALRRREKPYYSFFETVKVPAMLARPGNQNGVTLGSSRVSPSGN